MPICSFDTGIYIPSALYVYSARLLLRIVCTNVPFQTSRRVFRKMLLMWRRCWEEPVRMRGFQFAAAHHLSLSTKGVFVHISLSFMEKSVAHPACRVHLLSESKTVSARNLDIIAKVCFFLISSSRTPPAPIWLLSHQTNSVLAGLFPCAGHGSLE